MPKSTRKDTSKKPAVSFWEYFVEVFTEPILLTLAVVMLYNHFKGIWDMSPDFAVFWDRINETTRGNVLVAIVFCLVLVLWMLVVARRIKREFRTGKELKENIKQLTESVEKLAGEIRKDREK